MNKKIEGRVHKLGHNEDNVDFSVPLTKGDIIAAGRFFGHGRLYEQVVQDLKSAGIGCIIAESYSRSFYRQGISQGLTLLECDKAFEKIMADEIIMVDFDQNEITCKRGIIQFKPLSEIISRIVHSGGIIAHTRKLLGK
jgi:3-isopropylmalate/(R)-2-methylmalate dehydratase small subunit